MGAAQFVGRVGGLAVALGVGAAILVGAGSAWADGDDASAGSAGTSTSASSSAGDSATKQRGTSNRAAQRDDDRGATSGGDTDDARDADSESSDESPRTKRKADVETVSVDVSSKDAADTDESEDGDDAPPVTAAAPLLVAAATKPESSSEALPYSPSIDVVDGVITGDNTAEVPPDVTYTVVGQPSGGGKVTIDATSGDFSFLPYLSPSKPVTDERFSVLVAEQTAFTKALQSNTLVNAITAPIILTLHRIPIVSEVLSPLIGRSRVVPVVVGVADFVGPGQNPIAFTTKVTSFDGVKISVNFFPASGLELGEDAPTILNGPGLATAGSTNPTVASTVWGLVPGLAELRPAGYNVVTWDPRGEFASGGLLHLDSENYEARDVSAIIDWMSGQSTVRLEAAGDPLVGMVGGSYGGGIQLTSAGTDPRIDAIAPGIAWNSLVTALYPNHAFKTSWSSLLLLSLVATESRLDPIIYAGIATGVLTGFLTPGQIQFLASNAPATVVENITVPTLFLQGTVDGLFTLEQALINAAALDADVPVRMIWYCGGHGYCLDLDESQQDDQYAYLQARTIEWMNTYVMNKGEEPEPIPGPEFVWVDQNGDWFSADVLPTEKAFYGTTFKASGEGGTLPIIPFFGQSGPQNQAPFPFNITAAAESGRALNIEVEGPATTTHVVGAPKLTLTYSGLGTTRNIYAQLVDDETGRVLGNLVTPVPVRLDGREHTMTIDMENIAYTMQPGDSLTLQIVDGATAYEDFTSFGVVTVSDVSVTLPTAASATPVVLPPAPDTSGRIGSPFAEGLFAIPRSQAQVG